MSISARSHAAGSRPPQGAQTSVLQACGCQRPSHRHLAFAGGEKPLPGAVREDMARTFGHDFSRLRIHSAGPEAEIDATAVRAGGGQRAEFAARDPVQLAARPATGTGQPVQLLDWKKWGQRAGLGLLTAGGAVAGGLGAAALGATAAPVALAAAGGALLTGGLGYLALRSSSSGPSSDSGTSSRPRPRPSVRSSSRPTAAPSSSSSSTSSSSLSSGSSSSSPSSIPISIPSSTSSGQGAAGSAPRVVRRRIPKKQPVEKPAVGTRSGPTLTPAEVDAITQQAIANSRRLSHPGHKGSGNRFESDEISQERAIRRALEQAENRKARESKESEKKGRKKGGPKK